MSAPDFVAVGHITLDRIGGVIRPGGSALYAAVTADRLGLSAGILTSHGPDFPLELVPPGIEVVSLEAAETTRFDHLEEGGRRRFRVDAVARPLGVADVPEDWRDAGLVLLAPVIDEVAPTIVGAFDDAAIGAAAQGWLRELKSGDVAPRSWDPPPALLARCQALFVSTEDLEGRQGLVHGWLRRVPIVVVTAGEAGALLFVNGERYDVPARRTDLVDVTGAGDVFAAVFMIEYQRSGDPWEAAQAATCAASLSIGGEGYAAVPDRTALDEAIASYAQRLGGPP